MAEGRVVEGKIVVDHAVGVEVLFHAGAHCGSVESGGGVNCGGGGVEGGDEEPIFPVVEEFW